MIEYEKTYIGLVGKAGSGKDELCKMMMNNTGKHVIPHRIAFADALKRTCSEMFGVDIDYFHNRELKEVEHEVLKMTPRKMLQYFGTDIVRKVDPEHWVTRMPLEIESVIKAWGSGKGNFINYPHRWQLDEFGGAVGLMNLIIVPDVRFSNEVEFILGAGGYVINVERDNPDVGELDEQHASETSIDYKMFPTVDNNGTLPTLQLEAISILNNLGLR